MIHACRRTALGALLVALTGAVGFVPSAPAAVAAATDGPCPTTSAGVTVVVDFHGMAGRQVVTRCAPGSPGTGFKALTAAGFTITPTANNLAFLCRIDGLPTAQEDPCQVPSPLTAYWSYWTADRGGDWTYESEGGGTHKPKVGGVEGWSFARVSKEDDAPSPSTRPPAAPATTTTAKPSGPTTTSAPQTGGPGPLPDPTTTTARPAGGRTPTSTIAPSDDTTSSSTGDPTTTSAPPTSTSDDESASGTLLAREDGGGGGGGSSGGILVGGGVVLLLGSLIAFTTLRRRAQADPPLDPLP